MDSPRPRTTQKAFANHPHSSTPPRPPGEGTHSARPAAGNPGVSPPKLPELRVLLIEDNEDDAQLIRYALMERPGIVWSLEWADRLDAGLSKLAEEPFHIVLMDLSLPDSQGLDTVESVCHRMPDTPVVVITGMADESAALEALRKGAQDYLTKERLDGYGLAQTIRHAIERKREENALKRTTAELHALSEHVQKVREEERTRIARELHDELGQRLVGLKMEIAALEQTFGAAPSAAPEFLARTRGMTAMVNDTIDAIRVLVKQLRPSVLDHLSLVESLEWLAQEFQQRTGLRSRFRSSLSTVSLGPHEASSVFRIAQEALTNITRHARATSVDLQLDRRENVLHLIIQDDGRGITTDEAAGRSSFGLVGMRERALLLRGSVEITGRPGRGTRVHLQVPLRGDTPAG